MMLRRRGRIGVDEAWGNDAFDPLLNTEDLFERESTSNLFEEESPEPADTDDQSREEEATVPSIVPDGWTLEAYTTWLDGPAPEGWTEEQWTTYVEESKAKLPPASTPSEG